MKNIKDQKIVVVDDNEMTALLYEEFIKNLGFKNVRSYHDGMSCLNGLIEEPQIIFLDHNMGTMNGIEVLKKIKRFEPDIYVVFVSGQEHIDIATEALKFGAFDYVVKGTDDIRRIEEVLIKISNVQELIETKNRGPFRKFLSIFF